MDCRAQYGHNALRPVQPRARVCACIVCAHEHMCAHTLGYGCVHRHVCSVRRHMYENVYRHVCLLMCIHMCIVRVDTCIDMSMHMCIDIRTY